jgi:hypothetical protein
MIINYLSSSKVSISQEPTESKTSGKYTCHGRTFVAEACPTGSEATGCTTSDRFVMDLPFSVFTGIFQSRSGMDRDRIDLRLVPRIPFTVGTTTSDVHFGDTSINVNVTNAPIFLLGNTDNAGVYVTSVSGGVVTEISEISGATITGTTGGVLNLKTTMFVEGNVVISSGAQVTLLSNAIGTVTSGHPISQYNKVIYITPFSPTAWTEILNTRWINLVKNGVASTPRMINIVDSVNGFVHVTEPFDDTWDPDDGYGPIIIQLTIKSLHNSILKDDTSFVLGRSLIGGAYHPRGLLVIADYTRKKNTSIDVDYMFEMFS